MNRKLCISVVLIVVMMILMIPAFAVAADGDEDEIIDCEQMRANEEHTWITVPYGEETTLSVTDAIGPGLHYEWERIIYNQITEEISRETLSSETSPNLTIKSVNVTATYRCTVANDAGPVTAQDFHVNVDNELSVFTRFDPEDSLVPYGESRELKVTASVKSGGVVYQWFECEYEDGTQRLNPIEGANEPSYIAKNVISEKSYMCIVGDDYENYESVSFYLSVDNGLRITKQPQNTSVSKGGDAILSVKASSERDVQIRYQWFEANPVEGEVKLEGETAQSLRVRDVRTNKQYFCEVSEGNGGYGHSLRSETVTVSVASEFDVRTNGPDIVIKRGETKKLIVDAVSSENNIIYKWTVADNDEKIRSIEPTNPKKPWEMILEGTERNYKDETYWCKVSDGIHTEVVSFIISWDYGFKADYQRRIKVAPGETCKLKMKASSDLKDNKITYHWERRTWPPEEDSINIDKDGRYDGVKTSTLTIKNCNESVDYLCTVVDSFHTINEYFINVEVDNGFAISNDEAITLKQGETGVLKVNVQANDTDGMTYVWRKEGDTGEWEGINSENTDIFECTESGSYSCVVTDKYHNTKTAYFDVTVDSGLEVNHEVTVHAKDGEQVPLKIGARTKSDKGLIYKWFMDDKTEVRTEDSLTVTAGKFKQIKCLVSDGYDSQWVKFNIRMDGDFQAEADGKNSFDVAYGDEITCKVKTINTGSGNLEYTWIGVDGIAIESANNQDNCIVTAKKSGTIVCQVRDGNGMQEIPFNLNVETGLKLKYEEKINANPSKPVTLNVKASGSTSGRILNYKWYKLDEEGVHKELYGEIRNTLRISAPRNAIYECIVDDGVTMKKATIRIVIDPDKEKTIEKYKAEVETAKSLAVEMTEINSETGGKAVAQWKAPAGNSGFQIRYCLNKTFKKNVKIFRVNNPDARKTVIKKLKSGKTWFFQIRTYTYVTNKVSGKTSPIYGQWSTTKQAIIKK